MSRPMLELVLNDWVTDTNETLWASNSSMSFAKSAKRAQYRSCQREHREQLLQRGALKRGAGECAVVVAGGDGPPAFLCLALDVGLTGLALGIRRVEGKIKIVLRGEIHRLPGLYSVGPPLPRVLCITSRP